MRPASAFEYTAGAADGGWLQVTRRPEGGLCTTLPHVAPDAGPPDDDASRYVRIILRDGVAAGSLVVHLYDLGPGRGYRIAGLERPEP